MDFPINTKAEGRVSIPWEHQKYPNLTLQDSSCTFCHPFLSNFPIISYFPVGIEAMTGGNIFKPDWGDDGNLWKAWRRTCNPQCSARRLFSSMRNPSTVQVRNHFVSANVTPGANFSFVKGTSSQEDYCEMPYAHHTQGHFFSDWRSIPALYPVFSPAKARGFMDIRIPSHYYFSSTPRYTYG